MNDLIGRFADDLNKIAEIDIPAASNSVGAFAVIPLDASDLFSQRIKTRFSEKSSVDITHIKFLAVEPGAGNLSGSYSSNPPITNEHIVILYYVRI